MKLEYMDICPTWRCNAKCPTCNSYTLGSTTISRAQIDAILLEKRFNDLRRVIIEGGEPTLWNDLCYFIDGMLKKDTRKVCVISNGFKTKTLIEVADLFRNEQKRLLFYFSLNGIGEMHDASRGVKNVFSKTVKSAKAMKAYGFFVSFSFVGLKKNIGEYDDVVSLGRSLGIPVAVCYYTHRTKFGDHEWEAASEQQYNELLNQRLHAYKGFARRAYRLFLNNVRAKKLLPCDAGKTMVHIDPDGFVRPCHMDNSMSIGKVTDSGVVWDSGAKLERTLARIPEKCQYQNRNGNIELCNDCYIMFTLLRNKWRTEYQALKQRIGG